MIIRASIIKYSNTNKIIMLASDIQTYKYFLMVILLFYLDPCSVNPELRSYKARGFCRKYWDCKQDIVLNRPISVASCCGKGFEYSRRTHQCEIVDKDDKECQKEICELNPNKNTHRPSAGNLE